jgi:hypothetical protein
MPVTGIDDTHDRFSAGAEAVMPGSFSVTASVPTRKTKS